MEFQNKLAYDSDLDVVNDVQTAQSNFAINVRRHQTPPRSSMDNS
jgi:hypothetical protein